MKNDLHAAATAQSETVSEILRECARVYRLSKRFEKKSDKSVHWNVFPADFARCFETSSVWPSMLRNGITVGFNDDTIGVPDRWQRRSSHDYSDLLPRHSTAPEYCKTVKQMFAFCVRRFGLNFVRTMLNTEVGSPQLAEFKVVVSYSEGDVEQSFQANAHDLPLIYFCGRINESMRSSADVVARCRANPTFVEIGGGFGELSAKMKLSNPVLRSIIFDLPEPGAIQQYYLRQRFPGKKIYTIREFHEFGTAVFDQPFDFLLLPPALIRLLPTGWPSIAINIRSFQEMNWTSVVDYFVEIQRSLPVGGIFGCINRDSKPVGDQTISYNRFPFDERWRVLSKDKVPFQMHITEGFFERI